MERRDKRGWVNRPGFNRDSVFFGFRPIFLASWLRDGTLLRTLPEARHIGIWGRAECCAMRPGEGPKFDLLEGFSGHPSRWSSDEVDLVLTFHGFSERIVITATNTAD